MSWHEAWRLLPKVLLLLAQYACSSCTMVTSLLLLPLLPCG